MCESTGPVRPDGCSRGPSLSPEDRVRVPGEWLQQPLDLPPSPDGQHRTRTGQAIAAFCFLATLPSLHHTTPSSSSASIRIPCPPSEALGFASLWYCRSLQRFEVPIPTERRRATRRSYTGKAFADLRPKAILITSLQAFLPFSVNLIDFSRQSVNIASDSLSLPAPLRCLRRYFAAKFLVAGRTIYCRRTSWRNL